MKLISINLNEKEIKDINFPHYINPLKYYQHNDNRNQAKLLSEFYIDTIPFLTEQQKKESRSEIENYCVELFEKKYLQDKWQIFYKLQDLELALNNVIKMSEEALLVKIEQNTNLTQDIVEMKKVIDKISPFIAYQEKTSLLQKYAHLKIKQLICSASYSEVHLKQLPKRSDRKEITLEDRATKSQANQLMLEEENVFLFHMMCETFLVSPSTKANGMKSIKNKFEWFRKEITNNTNFKMEFTQSTLEKKFDQWIEINFHHFTSVISDGIEIIKQEKLLRLKDQRKRLPKTSNKAREKLSIEIKKCEEIIIQRKLKITLVNNHIKTQMKQLFNHITSSHNEDEFEKTAKMFGLVEKDYKSDEVEQEMSSIVNSWYKSILSTINVNLPSSEKVGLGLKVIEAGVIGSAFGVNGAMMGVGIALAQNRIQNATIALTERNVGKLNGKYKSKNFEVNENLKYAFDDSKEKAEVVNTWYINNLYEIDCKLENISSMEQKEKEAVELQSLYQNLNSNYQKMKTGEFSKTKAQEVFKSDIKMSLERIYRCDQKNTALYLQNLWQLSEKNSEIMPPTQSVLIEGNDAIAANQVLAIPPIQALVIRKPSSTELISSQEKKITDLNHIVLHSKKMSTQVHIKLSDSKRLGSLLILDNNKLQCWRADEFLTEQYREATRQFFKLTFEERVERFIREGSMDPLLIWFKENLFIEMYREKKEVRQKIVGDKLDKCKGKTLWHILCDEPEGFKLLEKIITLQKKTSSAIETTIGIAWKFTDYFSPNVKYQEMNPIEYAFKQGSFMILSEYLTNLVECEHSINNQKEIFAFMSVNDKNATTFCEALQKRIYEHQRQGQSTFGKFTSFFPNRTSSMLRIMSALVIRLARGLSVPTTYEDIAHFIKDLKEEKSSYITIPALSKATNTDIEKMAKNISDKFKEKNTSTNRALIQAISSLNSSTMTSDSTVDLSQEKIEQTPHKEQQENNLNCPVPALTPYYHVCSQNSVYTEESTFNNQETESERYVSRVLV